MINGKLVQDAPDTRAVLTRWIEYGQRLGNHTWSHPNLAKTALPDYLADIGKNESLLRERMGEQNFRYFRYPYLAEGDTLEKHDGVRRFLAERNYRIAEVAVDVLHVFEPGATIETAGQSVQGHSH